MRGTLTPAQAHKQYDEAVSAYRKWIPDPTLRMEFGRQADDYFRACALGVSVSYTHLTLPTIA